MTVLLRKALEVLLEELLRDDLISTVPYTIPIDGDELVFHCVVRLGGVKVVGKPKGILLFSFLLLFFEGGVKVRHLLQVTRLFIEHSLAAQGAEFGSEGVVIHYADDDGPFAATCKQKKASWG
jgi:hypothetical protein